MSKPTTHPSNILPALFSAAACATLGVATSANAAIVYAVNNAATLSAAQIVAFDTSAPNAVATIGSTGIAGSVGSTNGMSGLAFDASGNLWSYGAGTSSGLYSINTTTGAATKIGATTGLTAGDSPRDMAYNPATGQLTVLTYNLSVSKLYTVSTTTGLATLVGTISAVNLNFAGLAYKADGSGYLYNYTTDQMYTLSGLNGSDMSAGKVGPTASGSINVGLDFDWSRASNLLVNGVGTGESAGSGYTINATTGAGTSINTSTTRTYGDLAIQPVPEPTSLLLVSGALFGLARRRRV